MLEIVVRQGTKSPKRKKNEDFKIVDKKRNIFIVADGIGGNPSAQRASELASISCYHELKGALPLSGRGGILDKIHSAMGYSNQILCNLSDDNSLPFRQGNKRAGTTLDVGYIADDTLYIGHIGDGRVYLLREHELMQLTQDHSRLTPESDEGQAKLKEYFGIGAISRYIGDPEDFNPDLLKEPLIEGDIVLMATDGLTKMLFDSEIKAILLDEHFEKSARALLKASARPNKLADYLSQTRGISYDKAVQELPNNDATTVVLLKAEVKNA